jgi:predicted alpha-1,2-mannosidase
MRRALVALVALALVVPAGARAASDGDLTHYVDPFIGTEGAGFTFPGAAAPYGMVQNSPDTDGEFAYTGYQYIDHFIRGFSLVHTESMGVPEGGQLPVMPTTGDVKTNVLDYQTAFTHATESAKPGYYSVKLPAYQVDAELTAGLRVAMQRYTFPATTTANVLFDVGRQVAGGASFGDASQSATNTGSTVPGTNMARAHVLDDRTIAGTSNVTREHRNDYTVHFVARFDRPFTTAGTWSARGGAAQDGVTSVTGEGAGAYARFDTTQNARVVVKIGVSFVSEENALANLDAELPGGDYDFDALRARTRDAWNDALHSIVVEGGIDTDTISFYTALYHAQQHPNVFEDVNGDYLGYDHAVHRVGAPGDPMPAGSTYYANYSMWDTYRAQMPLLELIAPDRVRDMMRSLAATAVQGGRIPRWGWMDQYADFMNGEPGLQVVADAYCRGLVPQDALDILYPNMRALALDPARHRDPEYLDKGYVPAGASGTLEHAIGDFALANVAHALGHESDRDALAALAGNWRKQFDTSSRFMRPRDRNGNFTGNPYMPEMPDGWKEGTGWQYTWLVPQDVRGLFGAIGSTDGDAFVQQRLDTFFSESLAGPFAGAELQQKQSLYGIAFYGNQYAPSNEHDLQAPWLYDWLGQAWKGQQLQRHLQEVYRPAPDGLPGNDDLGTMSAWLVWSDLGFYPTTPGAPFYAMGSPLFPRAHIRLPNGEFRVEAPMASHAVKYVDGAFLNGTTLRRASFMHSELTRANGSLTFAMSATPNVDLWSQPGAAPPSLSTASSFDDFGCRP